MSNKITIRKPKSAETLMSDAKPVLPPPLLRQNSLLTYLTDLIIVLICVN